MLMEAVSISKMLSKLDETTWCNIPEDNHLHAHPKENLKSYIPDIYIFKLAGHKHCTA
jgi:hypothetical protein